MISLFDFQSIRSGGYPAPGNGLTGLTSLALPKVFKDTQSMFLNQIVPGIQLRQYTFFSDMGPTVNVSGQHGVAICIGCTIKGSQSKKRPPSLSSVSIMAKFRTLPS
jgi:hypothetical protein